MNAHDRRVVSRYWSYSVTLSEYPTYDNEVFKWLNKNFGSSSMKRRRMPRWCWSPEYTDLSGFARYISGANIFFHNEKDFTAFLLKWS